MRPPDLPGGNQHGAGQLGIVYFPASMRPPDLPGGNNQVPDITAPLGRRFNEAAGFTRRKPRVVGARHAKLRVLQ